MLDLHLSQIELDEILGAENLDPTRRRFLRALQMRVSDYLDPDFPKYESAKELAFDLAFVLRTSQKEETSPPMSLASLTKRESEILVRLEHGEPIKEIAGALYLSEATIKSHLRSLYRKLDAANRAQAIHRARRSGLL